MTRKIWVTAVPIDGDLSQVTVQASEAGATEIVHLPSPWLEIRGLAQEGFVEIEEPGDTLEGRLSALADRRYAASLSTTWRGYTVPCNTEAGTNVLGAIVGLQIAQSAGPITWKLDGAFVDLSAADLIDLGQTMRAHVQACFVNEGVIAAQLAAAQTIADRLAVDIEEGWP